MRAHKLSCDFAKEPNKSELEILDFWKKNRIFYRLMKGTKSLPAFRFFEGPPYANGRPGIHHVLTRVFKDAIIRFKTMNGYYVERKAGWDTHGLPTEVEVEKILGIKSKKEIEEKIGPEKFTEEAKKNVFLYKEEWEKLTERIGFWLDLKNPYITMTNDYIESLWWLFKRIHKNGFLYRDEKIIPWCSRCETSLSSHELAQGYKTVKDHSLYIKFSLKSPITYNLKPKTYFLVWTTTPWTLPANTALALNPEATYATIETNDEWFILGERQLGLVAAPFKIIAKQKGRDLSDIEYEPLYPHSGALKNAASYKTYAADFVETKDGTGIVHIAPAFGEDDRMLGKKYDLAVIKNLKENGTFEMPGAKWDKKHFKEANGLIISDLENRGLLFKKDFFEHEYPFCWRCAEPLIYYAKKAWFLKTTAVKEKMLLANSAINWQPDFIKKGRFGEWLKENVDWAISRERYWGTPLPIWECEKCKEIIIVGSFKELDEFRLKETPLPKDFHRPYIDQVKLRCRKCASNAKRIPEVADVWFDSGAMPFAQWHYPFENKEKIDEKKHYPADFICEGIDQTRGWFYTLLAVATLAGFDLPYKNVLVAGLVLDEKGEKMSKSKGNIVEPFQLIGKYGVETVRWYFYTLNQPWDEKRFKEDDVKNSRQFLTILWNALLYYQTYETQKMPLKKMLPKKLINRWLMARLKEVLNEFSNSLENYDIVSAARSAENFIIEDVSRWYIRRIREIMKTGDKKEKKETSAVLGFALLNIAKTLSPLLPFLSERLYREVKGKEKSVHFERWPKIEKISNKDKALIETMTQTRRIVSFALEERAKAGIKVRQPLGLMKIKESLSKDFLELIKGEVNVKRIKIERGLKTDIELDTTITPGLKEEGTMREFIRGIQALRKEKKLKPSQKIRIFVDCSKNAEKFIKKFEKTLKKEINAQKIIFGEIEKPDAKVKIDEFDFSLKIKV